MPHINVINALGIIVIQAAAFLGLYYRRLFYDSYLSRSDTVVFLLPVVVGMLGHYWFSFTIFNAEKSVTTSVIVRILLSVMVAGITLLAAGIFAFNRWGQ